MANKTPRPPFNPYLDAVPANQVNTALGDPSYQKRKDGPKDIWERPNSRSGRNILGEPLKRSYMQEMEELACSLIVWEPSQRIGRYLEQLTAGQPQVGRPLRFRVTDWVLFELAAQVWGGYRAADRNLANRNNWKRLRKAVRKAWPNQPHWRLSKRAISRSQYHRFRKKLLKVPYPDGTPILHELFKQTIDLLSLLGALHIGLFDPNIGSVTNPHTSQAIIGDATWMAGIFKNPPPGHPSHDSDSRCETDTRQKPGGGNAFGHIAVFNIARNPYKNERVILASNLLPQSPGKSDANLFTETILKMMEQYPDLTRGVRAAVYDMALRSTDIDKLQDHGIHAIVKTPRTAKGKTAAVNLGNHTFKHPKSNTTERLPVTAIHGTPTITLPDGAGHTTYQPLQRIKTQTKTSRSGRKTLYGTWAIPDRPIVPLHFVGATTLIRHNSTIDERHSKPHRRRTRALRSIPESDPNFQPLHGVRQDTESTNSQFKSLLPHGRARTAGRHRVQLNLLAFQIVTLNTALVANHQRTGQDIREWYGNHQANTRAGPAKQAA